MQNIINFLLDNYIILILFYLLLILILIFVILKIKLYLKGNFNEGNVFRYLKRIYKKYDYPYIKQIILPINKDTYAYYDAIVFGDKFIYLLEIKNHNGLLKIDTLEDWIYVEKNLKKHIFTNAFYELELKKHILNRFLDVNKNRLVEVVVINSKCKVAGEKGNNHMIIPSQLASLIRYYEKKENVKPFTYNEIEKKGNFILDTNIKNKKIRREVINDLKNGRYKR